MIQTKNIKKFKSILEDMVDVWEYEHYPYILTWCGILDNNLYNNTEEVKVEDYWEVWLLQKNKEVIGITGLYSLGQVDELWLGWFGLVPDARGQKLGKKLLKFSERKAKEKGAKILKIEVDKEQPTAMKFYESNKYTKIGETEYYYIISKNLK